MALELKWFDVPETRLAPIVLLHEGLGCVALWRDFPQKLAEHTGRRVLAYSRQGYGASPSLSAPRDALFMHKEAYEVLPELLRAQGIERCVLLGHSDGGSIALLAAASSLRTRIESVIVMAPHVMVEAITTQAIADAVQAYADDVTGMKNRLARYHHDVDGAFLGWARVWLSKEFASWSIEAQLPNLECKVLAIQGTQDQYGSLRQIELIAEYHSDTQLHVLEHCRHSPHLDQPAQVLKAVADFLAPKHFL